MLSQEQINQWVNEMESNEMNYDDSNYKPDSIVYDVRQYQKYLGTPLRKTNDKGDRVSDESEENWYILLTNDVDGKIEVLSIAGIPCNDLTKQTGTSCVAFPSSYIDKVKQCLGEELSTITIEPTSMKNMFVIKFCDNIPDFALEKTFESSMPSKNFEGGSFLLPVVKSAFDNFNLNMILSNPHGDKKLPVSVGNDSYLYVHFYSAPSLSKKTKMYKVFGIPLDDNQSYAVKPSNTGVQIKDDEGLVVAEYVNNNLYILFDLPHGRTDSVTELFARIMRAYFALKGKTVSELINFYQGIRKPMNISSRDEFVRACSKLYEKNISSMEQSAREYDKVIDEYNSKLIQSRREREILLMKLEPLRSSNEARKKWADTEYDTLLKSPHVKDVMVSGKTIHVFTDMIKIDYGGRTYDMGEFRIDIHTDGDNSGVKAYNLTKTIGGSLYHPHVRKTGDCCLGNISSGVTKLLAEYQYVVLAQLMVTFLQSYNPESAYGAISNWK